MDINKFLSKLFGNKSTRDMKLIQPWVEKVKAAYPAIQALDDDALRAKTKELQEKIQSSANDLKEKIAALKAKVEDTPIEDREVIFNQIDKLEKELEDAKYKALSSSSALTERCRESHILEMLRANKDSLLHPSEQPPYIINIPEE